MSLIALAVTTANSSYVYAVIGKDSDQSLLGVYRSTDSGNTFTTQVDGGTINLLGYDADGLDFGTGQAFYDLAIVASPTNSNFLTVGGVNHWQSNNGGTNWINTSVWNSGEVHADVHYLTYLPGSSSVMFSCNDGGIFKSIDYGNTWVDISNNLAISQVVMLGLSSNDENMIVAGKQDNGTNLKIGSSWKKYFRRRWRRVFYRLHRYQYNLYSICTRRFL
ncbi:MAG: hypothetical protein IPO37_22150 [Saprospiraceae bacterium]|nr:hypothetical protein [Saprospiraceae bacterium]